MSILFIQSDDNKFVNSMRYSASPKHSMLIGDINQNLYELYYRHKFTHIIFMISKINPEIHQFILEYHDTIKCYIYHHSIVSSNIMSLYGNKIIHLIDGKDKIKSSVETITIPRLINKSLFNNSKTPKVNTISCFLDNVTQLPASLTKFLYPNTKLPIKLFNGHKIKHHQHLGNLTEPDKAQILKLSKYYLTIDEHYLAEAWASGCEVLDLAEIDSLEAKKYKTQKTYQDYTNFIENLLHE